MATENDDSRKHRPRWLVGLLMAAALLVILALGAHVLYDRAFPETVLGYLGSDRLAGDACWCWHRKRPWLKDRSETKP